ncbi:hypothetical protein B0H11DRAFT_2248269 [Mycena galericulata]|nr:hypothetical protein B0H11DRAFT_2248269 [Mycena galericulata]
MTTLVKTIVATGASSGLGFEAVKQLLTQSQSYYKFILGARDTATTQAAYDSLTFDRTKHVKIRTLSRQQDRTRVE